MSPARHTDAMMHVAHTAFGLSLGVVALIFVAGVALYFITRR
ncbi:hypothetical protein BH09PSE2_BH09PSE2_09580 [soil metagenome]